MDYFQYDRPVFVKVPFEAHNRKWLQGDHFPWKEMSIDGDTVKILFDNSFLYHSDELSATMKVGDGLEELDIEGLHQIVEDTNKRVKAIASNERQFINNKMKQSTKADRQRGLIRSWRRNLEDWLIKAEKNKKG